MYMHIYLYNPTNIYIYVYIYILYCVFLMPCWLLVSRHWFCSRMGPAPRKCNVFELFASATGFLTYGYYGIWKTHANMNTELLSYCNNSMNKPDARIWSPDLGLDMPVGRCWPLSCWTLWFNDGKGPLLNWDHPRIQNFLSRGQTSLERNAAVGFSLLVCQVLLFREFDLCHSSYFPYAPSVEYLPTFGSFVG